MASCSKHPQVTADYRCQQCSKPICTKCIVNDRFCSDACNQKYSTFMANYKKPVAHKRNPIPALIGFVVVVFVLYKVAKHMGYI
jgi:hypothetical protein